MATGPDTLVIQTGFLGDLVLTLPLLAALHERRPERHVTVAVREGLGDLIRDQPGVADTIVIRKRQTWREQVVTDVVRFRRLRATGFRTVLLAHRSFRTGLHAFCTRAPRRIGFAAAPSSWACTRTVAYDTRRHVSERFLALLDEDMSAVRAPSYAVAGAAREAAERLLAEHGVPDGDPFVTIAPGSVWATKRWTEAGFSELARWAVARGFRVVLVGTAEEHARCDRVRSATGEGAINLSGRTGPAALAAILERARAHLGNDSGPGHLAAAVGTPVVAIFGPTDPGAGFHPLGNRVLVADIGSGLDCRPCSVHGSRRCPVGHHRCMNDLEARTVIEAIERWPLNPIVSCRDTPPARPG
ncbi:MAG: lipopolysaccharide heptosyltransferase II [Acidobacteria bacterium]|nr:lipopolysaccharide heptosyltransferase II [Acidobacteriota bacterium]NIM62121.1 lipopolysaccharide heptosyltransferase II [Acidobacteriota bacterium]NIO59775.1 lipopolysaccharide heptosyltransferase II [Acidobacteriota bacterium]NIQ30858.1 lipopolysaccharide heptosyltransferase II [Acidobacteriota bacterium]NIQ85931.1 lipopolysaccharide heptosyltransferase II [Acidobacteriota bacterium]